MVASAALCGLSALFFLLVSLGRDPERAALQRNIALGFAAAGVLLGILRALEAVRVGRRLRQLEAEDPATRSGMTLIVALLIGSALAALALHALTTGRAALRAAESAARARRLGVLAAGEARRRLQELADDPDPGADHLDEHWARTSAYTLPEGPRVESRVEDENRRFNLNNLALAGAESGRRPVTVAASELLGLAGAPDPRRRLDALRAALRNPTPDAEPHYIPLEAWADLTAIEGFDRDFLERDTDDAVRRVRPADVLTVAPFDPLQPQRLNLNTAPEGVLLGVFGRERADLVRAVRSLREAAPLRSLEPLALLTDPVAFAQLRPWLDIRSTLFRVDVRVEQAEQQHRVRTLAHRDGDGRVRILEWTER